MLSQDEIDAFRDEPEGTESAGCQAVAFGAPLSGLRVMHATARLQLAMMASVQRSLRVPRG